MLGNIRLPLVLLLASAPAAGAGANIGISGVAALTAAWRLSNLDGKPEGLAFTAKGRAIVALYERKARRNLFLLEPAIASA